MTIPKNPGTPGAPKYLDSDIVGILTNGVLLDSHKQTWSYDSCNGHSDKKHQYHYHIPPKCVLESHGISFAEEHTWWINDAGTEVRSYAEMKEQFLETGPPSPIVGMARDGFPIFGLYDENGRLQHGADYGGSLDECNGKVDSLGNYGYYITVDPPFAPPCLRGEMGVFSYSTSDVSCPKDGIKNTILDGEAISKCETVAFGDLAECDPNPDLANPPIAPTAGASTPTSGSTRLFSGIAATGAAFLLSIHQQ